MRPKGGTHWVELLVLQVLVAKLAELAEAASGQRHMTWHQRQYDVHGDRGRRRAVPLSGVVGVEHAAEVDR